MFSLIWRIKDVLFRVFNKRTLGARALVIANNQVLLVQHSYMPKWYTIGGGIEQNETPLEAVQRELYEEVGITCTKPPKLFGVYHNNFKNRNDYVIFYLVEAFQQTPVNSPEIALAQWFPLTQLPDEISPATKRRLDEYLGLRPQEERW